MKADRTVYIARVSCLSPPLSIFLLYHVNGRMVEKNGENNVLYGF
jgi:hypothetical protein